MPTMPRDFQKADKITCIVDRSLSPELASLLRGLDITGVFVQPGRSAVLRERRFALDPRKAVRLEEDPVEVVHFYVPRGQDAPLISYLAAELELAMPGRGSLFSEHVELHGSGPLFFRQDPLEGRAGPKVHLQSGLVGLCCIVQRGEADTLAKAVLEMGLAVPVVTYGTGLGLRNKLGLLRITIPVNKEVLHLVVNRSDALEAFGYLTDAARLQHPGKGFLYMSPLRLGVINSKIYRGELHHLASTEQIVAAIDLLSKGTDWRRKAPAAGRKSKTRAYLSDLVNYTLVSNEGTAEQLVRWAMQAGAGGATVCRLRYDRFREQEGVPAFGARESSDLVVSKNLVTAVHEAIHHEADGTARAGDEIVELSVVEKASTYRHR